MNSITHYSPYGIGLYTLLVLNPDENKPLLYKQVSSEGSFSVTLPSKHDGIVIHFIHNRWIGVDEELHLGESTEPIRKKKSKTKATASSNPSQVQPSVTTHVQSSLASQVQPATANHIQTPAINHIQPGTISHVQTAKSQQATPNQDELDLLNFISWEDDKEVDTTQKENRANESKTYPNLIADTPQGIKNNPIAQQDRIQPNASSPISNGLNVDEFLSSLFH